MKLNKKVVKPLWEYTRDLHHACEAHVVGGAMATGKPPKAWYASWLLGLFQIHSVIDPYCSSPLLWRANECMEDFIVMNFTMDPPKAATEYAKSLTDEKKLSGAIYVLTGAHLMGGEIMRRRLEGFPTKHLEWEDRKEAISHLQQYRLRNDIGEEARDCFKALLAIMDEIKETYPLTEEK